MGILRLVARIMGRISTFRSYQFVLLLAAALAVVAFYYFASERQNFSSTTKRIKQTQASHNTNRNGADLTVDTGLSHPAGSEELGREEQDAGGESEGLGSKKGGGDAGDHRYHALMMFTKVDKSRSLQDKFRVAMLSMVKHGRFLEGEALVLHFVSDQASKELGERMLQEFLPDATFKYEVGSLNVLYVCIVCVVCALYNSSVINWFQDEKKSSPWLIISDRSFISSKVAFDNPLSLVLCHWGSWLFVYTIYSIL